MSVQATFFKESHTSLGVFYPMHYMIAVFDTLPAAHRAEKNLRNASFRDDDVLVCTGPEFIEFEKRETGVAGSIMQAISRFFKTEQLSTDHNLELAEHYAAFLFVHCPKEQSKIEAWDIVQEEKPLTAHYYDRIAVDQLAGGFSTD
ncbi:MAG: hypothetical protein ABIR70_17540 [Bryobacteraceae bacterium]